MKLSFLAVFTTLLLCCVPHSLTAQAVTLPAGNYAFLVQGASSDLPFGLANQAGLIGSFRSDGSGHISNGLADFNSPQAAWLDFPFTGSYVTQGEQILLTLTSAHMTETLLIPPPPDHLYDVPVTTWYMTAQAPSSVHGSGTLTAQNATAFRPGHVLGAYTSLLSGESACDAACLFAGFHARMMTGSGSFVISSPTTDFTISFTLTNGTSPATIATSGPISPHNPFFFPSGRMILGSQTKQPQGTPSSFVVYIVDETHLLFMSTDPHSRSELVSGAGFEPGAGLSPGVVRADQ